MASCPLCRSRKGRRPCPAKGELICAHCCGQKRVVEIRCPHDCVYLSGAHAPGWARETEKARDARRAYAMVDGISEPQAQLLFLGLMGLTALRTRHPGLDDSRMASATVALRKTVETRLSGLLYEHPPDDARAQAVMRDLNGLFEAEDKAGRKAAPADRDLLAVLKAIEAGLAIADDDSPTSFLDTVTRMTGQRAQPQASRLVRSILS